MLKPIIQYLVNTASWSCVNKIPQNKWLTQRTIFMGLETGSPEERELVKTNETEWGGTARINFLGSCLFLCDFLCILDSHMHNAG